MMPIKQNTISYPVIIVAPQKKQNKKKTTYFSIFLNVMLLFIFIASYQQNKMIVHTVKI